MVAVCGLMMLVLEVCGRHGWVDDVRTRGVRSSWAG